MLARFNLGKLLKITVLLVFSASIINCGGSSSSDPAPGESGRTYIFEDAGVITHITVYSSWFTGAQVVGGGGHTFSGTVTAQQYGMLELVMDTSTDPADTASLPINMTAREVRGAMLSVVQNDSFSVDHYSETMTGHASGGSCASLAAGDVYQGLILPDPTADRVTSDFWFTASLSAGVAGLDLAIQPYLLSEDIQDVPASAVVNSLGFTCSGAVLSNAGGDEYTVTPSGVVFAAFGGGGGAILTPVATGLTDVDVSQAGRAFSGISGRPNPAAGGYGDADDYIGLKLTLMNGNYSTVSGSNNDLIVTTITDVQSGDLDLPNQGFVAPAQSPAGTAVPDGLFDNASAVEKGNTLGRFIVHVMPDGSHFMMGVYEDVGAAAQDDWEIMILSEFLAPPTIPAKVTTGNQYYMPNDDGGKETEMILNVDIGTNAFMGVGDTGQVVWGTASTLASGYIRMVVDGSTEPGDRGSTSVLYAFEMPDSMINIVDAGEQIAGEGYRGGEIGFDMTGTCMGNGDATNMMHGPGFSQTADFAYGTLSAVTGIDVTAGLWMLGNDMTVAAAPDGVAGLTCNGNMLNGALDILHTGSGLSMLVTGPDDVWPMLPQVAVVAGDLVGAAQTYRGMIVRPHFDAGLGEWITVTEYISATGDDTNLIGTAFTNVETNTLSPDSATIALAATASATPGMFDNSTINFGAGAEPFRVMAYLDTSNTKNKHILVGIIQTDMTGNMAVTEAQDYIFVVLFEQ